MRICILANARAVHTRRWAQALAGRGHAVTVLSIRAADIPGVTVETCSVGPVNSSSPVWTLLSYLWLLLRARALVARIAPDVVNPHYCITHGSIAALAGLRPRVVNLWGSDVVWDGPGSMPWWHRLLIRLSLERADAIASTSNFMVEAVLPLLKRCPPVTLVPFGVDCARIRPGERTGEGLTVGFLKTFNNKYAPENFVLAAALAAGNHPLMNFVMAGDGPLRARCEALARDLGIADRIRFLGAIPHEEVPAVLRSFDILVNCSRVESFGVVICEASASGLPVVATDVGGVRETLVHGETGILVPPGRPEAIAAALSRLARDPALRRRLGEAGRRRVERLYRWEDCVTRFEALLTSAIQGRGTVASGCAAPERTAS